MKRFIFLSSIFLALIPCVTQAISLTPSVIEVSAARGTTTQQHLTVINTKGMEQTFYLGILKFKPSSNGETPEFISYEKDHSGLPEWIQLPFTEFRVPANSKGDVPFKISVPNDVASGGYYAAIIVSQSPSDVVASNGAIIEAKTAALVLLTIQGTTTEHLELLDFQTHQSAVTSQLGGTYIYRLQNQGNVHLSPKGTITLTDIFGRTVIQTDANPSDGRVLPGSERPYDVNIETQKNFFWIVKDQMGFFAIGPIKASLHLTYGQNNQPIDAAVSFFSLPWQLLVCILGLLVVIVGLIRLKKPR